MKEFKFISAHLNSKGKLEVMAYKEPSPLHLYSDHPEESESVMFQVEMESWQSSAEVFRPFNEEHTKKINAHIFEHFSRSNLLEKSGIDVTDFVEIQSKHSNMFGWQKYAFYKTPSKNTCIGLEYAFKNTTGSNSGPFGKVEDQPEQTEGERWDEIKDEFYVENNNKIHEWSDKKRLVLEYHAWLKSKFIIKRK